MEKIPFSYRRIFCIKKTCSIQNEEAINFLQFQIRNQCEKSFFKKITIYKFKDCSFKLGQTSLNNPDNTLRYILNFLVLIG